MFLEFNITRQSLPILNYIKKFAKIAIFIKLHYIITLKKICFNILVNSKKYKFK